MPFLAVAVALLQCSSEVLLGNDVISAQHPAILPAHNSHRHFFRYSRLINSLAAVRLKSWRRRPALVRGALIGRYPYPFIDVGALGYGRVLVNSVGVLLGFILIALILVGAGALKKDRAPSPERS